MGVDPRKIVFHPIWIFLFILCFPMLTLGSTRQEEGNRVVSSVKVVLFYIFDNTDCQQTLQQLLPDLKDRFGAKVTILTVNNSSSAGGLLFLNAIFDLDIPNQERLPLLVIGDIYLNGSKEIEQELPSLIEKKIKEGDTTWPSISGISKLLTTIKALPASEKDEWYLARKRSGTQLMLDRFLHHYKKDKDGNRFAVIVLAGMLFSLLLTGALSSGKPRGYLKNPLSLIAPVAMLFLGVIVSGHLANILSILESGTLPAGTGESVLAIVIFVTMTASLIYTLTTLSRNEARQIPLWSQRIIPAMIIIGVISAGYLAYTGIFHIEASCGKMGDCNAVQQSQYASLFGIFPVSLLGLMGNLLIGLSWASLCREGGSTRHIFATALYGFTLFGTLFFIYLTFLEPFVIGGTCFWCLSAAIAMTVQFYAAASIRGRHHRTL